MLAPTVQYLTVPADIVNQAVDMLGQSGKVIGSVTDGTPVAETARRNYGQALRQLLRTAHWAFARKQAKLTLLGDATGTAAIGVSQFVECPWQYAFAWPIDGVQGRWLPWSPTNAQPTNAQGVPLTTGVSVGVPYPMMPGRFLVSSSDQYPVEVGGLPWDQLPDLSRTEGLGPTSRKIILTDSGPYTQFVYTRLVTVIEEWDDLFRQAMVTMMAMVIAPVAIEDPKMMIAERDRLAATLRNAIADARVANANEAGFPQTINKEANYISARSWGAGSGGLLGGGGYGFGFGGGGAGYLGLGWGSMSWGGEVY